MMVEKEDLGLSLSLSSTETRFPLQLNLMPSPSPASFLAHHHKTQWSDLLAPQERRSAPEEEARLQLRGIDVNRAPPERGLAGGAGEEEEAGASSPNSTLSSVSGKRHGGGGDDGGEPERASSRGISDEEDGGEGSRKKLRLSKDQSAILEESFKEHNTLNPKQKQALAKQLNLRPRQVEVWFQNRRARTKLKQTEVDCEFLKRCCENLTEENRRLQKEVQELRALKLSPQFYMHMTPPTTLTMCPSCERISNSTAAAAAAAAAAATSAQTSIAPPPPPVAAEPPHHFLHHPRPLPAGPAGAGTPSPLAPIPLRPFFLDAPVQRS